MATDTSFKIARRVIIAKDALSPQQRRIVEPLLANKKSFISNANRPGTSRALPGLKNTFVTKAGADIRVIYTTGTEGVVVQDILRKETLEQLLRVRRKPKSTKKPPLPPLRKERAAKLQEA